MVAEHGWRLLPAYEYDSNSGVWHYHGDTSALPCSLDGVDLSANSWDKIATAEQPDYTSLLKSALASLLDADTRQARYPFELDAEAEALRWFVLPQEVATGPDRIVARGSS
jgi:hypothetical protein